MADRAEFVRPGARSRKWLAEGGYPAGGLFGFLQAAFVAGADAEEDCSGQAEGDPAGIIGAT